MSDATTEGTESVTITELIAQLEVLRARHGDLPVLAWTPGGIADQELTSVTLPTAHVVYAASADDLRYDTTDYGTRKVSRDAVVIGTVRGHS